MLLLVCGEYYVNHFYLFSLKWSFLGCHLKFAHSCLKDSKA